VGHGAVQLLFGDLGQLLDLLDLGLSLGRLELFDSVLEELGVGSVSRVLGDTVVVLSSKLDEEHWISSQRWAHFNGQAHSLETHETGSQRRPDGRTQSLVSLEQGKVVDLESLSVQHRVLRLFTGRSDQVELVGDGVSLLDLLSGPLRGTARWRLGYS